MALSATFKADFADFYAAVDKAESKLIDFGAGADKIGSRLNRMSEQFSGKQVIQEASLMVKAVEEIGGVSKLTDKELARLGATAQEAAAKMKLMGMDVPKNIQEIADKTKSADKASIDWMGTLGKIAASVGIAFSVDAIVGFIGSVFDAAGAVKDLSDQWGASTTFVQKWSAAARQSGIEAETVGKTIQFTTEKLTEQTEEYDALLKNIGLSGEALRGMSSEDAYTEIIKGLSGIKDQTLQLDAAAAILGPGYKKMIGGIRDGIVETAEAQTAMSEETIKRLEAAGAAWADFKNKIVIFSGEMLSAVMRDASAAASGWGKFWGDVKATAIGGLEGHKKYMEGLQAAADAAVTALDESAKATTAAGAATDANAAKIKTAAQIHDELRKKTEATTKAEKDRATALAATQAAQDAYVKQVEGQSKALGDLVDTFEGSDLIGKAKMYATALEYSIPVQEMTRKQQDAINKVMKEAIEVYAAAGKSAPENLLAIAKATEVVKAKTESLGASVGSFDWSNVTGATLGDAPFTSGLSGQIAGLTKPGMFDNVGKGMAQAAGGSMLKAIQGGGNVFQAAGSAIGNFVLDPQQSGMGKAIEAGAKKLPGMIGGAIGSAIPMVGPLIGPAIGFLTDKIAGMFGPSEAEKMRDNFISAAGGIKELTKDATAAGVSLDRLMSAKDVEGVKGAIAEIQEGIEFQESALDKAKLAADRYGFSLEELGPAFQKNELEKHAQQLYADFRTLWHAGVDQVAITDKMSESVNAYVNEAKKLGFSVPIAMKPMLEQFVKAGDLLDENGNAITSLEDSGITFAVNMTEAFEEMVNQVQRLVEALDRNLNPALDKAAEPRKGFWGAFDRAKAASQAGGTTDAEGYARGTGGFKNFGTGTPVILHGWEAVVPKDDAAAFATVNGGGGTGGGGGGGAAPAIIINAQGAFFDTPESLQRLATKVSDALTAKYSIMGKLRAAV